MHDREDQSSSECCDLIARHTAIHIVSILNVARHGSSNDQILSHTPYLQISTVPVKSLDIHI